MNTTNLAQAVTLTTEYSTPYNALIRDDVVMGVPRYFLERWVPVLGPSAATVVNTLRQLDYRCHEDTITISGEALAREAAMSRRHLYTCMEHAWIGAFVRLDSGKRVRLDDGQIVQEANRYRVRMDDPLTPADADHLLRTLQNLADTPLEAARGALNLDARALWASDPTTTSEHFTLPRAITARDVLQRAFPTWTPIDDEQRQALAQEAENLHRHITLVREDGRTSKIIVAQYFRRRWWNRLGHDLAWAYLWLRGTVYDNPAEGIRRNTCWIPALNTILEIIGRSREWWRRNVENAKPDPDGWVINDFFRQVEAQKGRDPDHPQWVARQFVVTLDIPIAPDDRARYEELLRNWPEGKGITPPGSCTEGSDSHDQTPKPTGIVTPTPADTSTEVIASATMEHTGDKSVCHNGTHRPPEGVPQQATPDQAGSATTQHTGKEGMCHNLTHASATTEHRSESRFKASSQNQVELSSSKQPEGKILPSENPLSAAGAAEDENGTVKEKNLFDQLVDTLRDASQTPLYSAASVQAWLQQTWPEPVRPHTPAWAMAIDGQLSPRDLVALALAVWADPSIKFPPRYLSWIVQRWKTLPNAPPVDHWDQWRALAALPLEDWFEKGRMQWIELVPRDHRALPFGLDMLESELEAREAGTNGVPLDGPLDVAAMLQAARAELTANGLDERPGGEGALTVREIWRATLGHLSVQLNRTTYVMWVEGARAVSYADGVLTVRARHDGARDWLAEHLNHSIEGTVSSLAQCPITVRYIAGKGSGPAAPEG
jgi:hypothetical protein